MPANQSTKTERDREFRELDSSISSNLSEREGKKERKRRTERERENGSSKECLGFWGFLVGRLSLNRGKIKEWKRNKREENGSATVK